MRRYIILIVAMMAAVACHPEVSGSMDIRPEIFPDYKEVTIPSNIAPLNFSIISDQGDAWTAVILSDGCKVSMHSSDGLFSFRKGQWRKLLDGTGKLEVQINEKRSDGWFAYQPFEIYVSEDEIDPYLTYRLITPGYSLWREMSLCQRNLENFAEKTIYANTQGKGNCINCHSFCERDAESMLFHMRSELAGTYIFKDGMKEKLDTRTDHTISSLVYPYWHPSGRYVAFSVNKTNQFLHTTDPDRIEVFDEASDVVVYDVGKHQIITSDMLSGEAFFETFPTFSPDGRGLYFCSSKAADPMPQMYKEARYSLCRIDFDPDDCSFGEVTDTLYNAMTEGGSVSYPRISPDGRFLVFTLSEYGNFSIWHKDADLYCIDLQNGDMKPMLAANSPDVESYHSWSSDSRWLVISSRRDDGLYTRPYICHVGEDGQVGKPFLLPQKDPMDFYDSQMYSYNIPEFTTNRIKLTGREIAAFAAGADAVRTGFMKK